MTSGLAVIAYPTFSESDRARIQSVREQHDPQFGLLDPHFTFVFPVEAPLADVVADSTVVADSSIAFPFVLSSVRAVKDVFGVGGHVFLVAQHGADQVVALHSRLYGGTLRWAHRADISYVPHITVAASVDFSHCEKLAQQLEDGLVATAGLIEALTIVEVVGGTVRTVSTLRLKGRTG